MTTRTRIAAALACGSALIGPPLVIGAGDANAWQSGGAHATSASLEETVVNVTFTNTKSRQIVCKADILAISELDKAKQVATISMRAIGADAAEMGNIQADVTAIGLAPAITYGSPTLVASGQKVTASLVLPSPAAAAYTVAGSCVLVSAESDTTIEDIDAVAFGVGEGQSGTGGGTTPETPGSNGSSDVFGSVDGVLPDLGALFG
ncbi:MAG: hypothetical protein LBE07_03060 [Gordonia sp. (in: high G+C Gram-positive bacteria)]|jgi:hypothetical protein|nr:hypothetical protein [Gordonia sp. (in: high G+C Gram-positive bacteria)]